MDAAMSRSRTAIVNHGTIGAIRHCRFVNCDTLVTNHETGMIGDLSHNEMVFSQRSEDGVDPPRSKAAAWLKNGASVVAVAASVTNTAEKLVDTANKAAEWIENFWR